ncbi:MAG: Rne/Rng family ribonuclease [Myxococcales bacterium]|nr:Rne/Rng family ribonuclease [Myxococcales bacterium]USN51453.1 MAG: Rne/Rng family ribonuclease [Myxococcales bacterium]
MSKEIIINASMAEEVRIAILEKGRLIDLDIETSVKAKHKGNIYKGIISNIEDGLDAAFVEIGEERQAFLPLSEIRPSIYPDSLKNKKKVKISDVLSRGQEVVVQVTKDEIGTKGAAVSTYLSLPGRFVVLMHSDESGGGISRKIDSESARSAAREMLSRLNVPEHMAVIIRTAGMSGTKSDLFRDFRLLCETWQQIDKGAQLGRAPTLLYREPDIVIRTIRDYFSPDVSRIIIDDEEEYEEALNYFREYMPDLVQLLDRHRKREPIFHHYGIEKAISELFDREVRLPSGGYVTIEQTEALVSIDVNSGSSTKEEDHEATVYKTNLEAADEIARQLRLRDMGGIVVIDFIDMVSRWHRRDVERRLRDLMHNDKARVKLGRISENGILELTRQRLRQSHSMISRVICSSCGGTGRVRDAQGLSLAALRRIAGYLAKKRVQLSKLTVKAPVEVANLLNNKKRKDLLALSESYELEIEILGDIKLSESQIEFSEERRGYAGLRAKTPSREYWDNQEQSSHNRRSKNSFGSGESHNKNRHDFPPPSIGPVPTLIEIDECEKALDVDLQQQAISKEESVNHFDDPLTEALFGMAPSENLEDLLKRIAPESTIGDDVHEERPEIVFNGDQAIDIDMLDEEYKSPLASEDTTSAQEKSAQSERRRSSSRRRNYRSRKLQAHRNNDKYLASHKASSSEQGPKSDPNSKDKNEGLNK